jgi:predicted heme/steroid binding protein
MNSSSLNFVADSTFIASLVVAVIVLILYRKCRSPPPPSPALQKKRVVPEPRDFTKAELAHFDGIWFHSRFRVLKARLLTCMCTPSSFIIIGKASKSIYVAILGKVYDVTGSDFYTPPDGPYSMFAGNDITFALARVCFSLFTDLP